MSLRIALISPVWFRVPPDGYGGIEWVGSLLADSLAEAGYDVTLFASGDSRTKAKLVSVYDEAPSLQIGRSIPEMYHALACFERAEEFAAVVHAAGAHAARHGERGCGKIQRRDVLPAFPPVREPQSTPIFFRRFFISISACASFLNSSRSPAC